MSTNHAPPASSPQIAPEPGGSESLPRRLTVIGLWLLMINGMIGAGIFGVPAELARLAAGFSPSIFLLGGVLMAPVILCFAQLGGSVRGSGGPVRYVSIAFGPAAGFQAGWAFYVARVTSFAANLNLLVTSILYFWPAGNSTLPRSALLLLLVALFAWANMVSVRASMRSLGALTVLKLLPLALLLLFGLSSIDPGTAQAMLVPRTGVDVGAALLLVIYAYVGFESGLVPAGEARNPQRDMPRALLLSLLICAVGYALLQWVSISVVPTLAQSSRPLVDVGEALLGAPGALLLIVGVIASIGGNLVSSMFSSPRITYSLAEMQQLPGWFGRVHPRFQTPTNSVAFYAVAVALLSVTGSFVWLAGLSVLTRLLLFLACIAAMPRVRRHAGESAMRLPGGWTIPLLAFAVCIALLSQVTPRAWLATAALLAVGSGLYLIARRRRVRE